VADGLVWAKVQDMNSSLRKDLRHLEQLAFKGNAACRGVLERFHNAPHSVKLSSAYPLMRSVRPWLLAPFSLWPIDFAGLGSHLVDCAYSGKEPDGRIKLLLSALAKPPSAREQGAVAQHEHDVRAGNYEPLIKARPKFTHKEQELIDDPRFRRDWDLIKASFDVSKYRDGKGIIRRRMIQERSFRPDDWGFQWRTMKDRFRNVFDTFCHRWVLYGMEKDMPLLQKVSINITPYGTMVFIPHYWSLDWRRDLNWEKITKLHRARDVRRQGEKLGSNQRERRLDAKKAQTYLQEAKRLGLKGDARTDHLLKKMGWHPDTDPSRLRRLLKQQS
jgi:hypothetical protein